MLRPSALIGAASVGGAFSGRVLEALAEGVQVRLAGQASPRLLSSAPDSSKPHTVPPSGGPWAWQPSSGIGAVQPDQQGGVLLRTGL